MDKQAANRVHRALLAALPSLKQANDQAAAATGLGIGGLLGTGLGHTGGYQLDRSTYQANQTRANQLARAQLRSAPRGSNASWNLHMKNVGTRGNLADQLARGRWRGR